MNRDYFARPSQGSRSVSYYGNTQLKQGDCRAKARHRATRQSPSPYGSQPFGRVSPIAKFVGAVALGLTTIAAWAFLLAFIGER